MIPSVAGCTTGSLCPTRCPIRRGEVPRLYQAELLSSVRMLTVDGQQTMCTRMLCILRHKAMYP